MPSTSKKQAEFMEKCCKNKHYADSVGMDQETACEFYRADQEKKRKEKKGKKVSKESHPSSTW